MRSRKLFARVSLLVIILLMALSLVLSVNAQEDRLLVWKAPGLAPGDHGATQTGQIGFFGEDGTFEPLIDVPEQTSRVLPCGNGALSRDGRHFAFFVGQDVGSLYMLTDTKNLVEVSNDQHAYGCTGNGTFQFSPNSQRFGIVDLAQTPRDDNFPPLGRLYVANVDDPLNGVEFGNVTAFTLQDDMLAYVGLFVNNKGEAVEAGIITYDGNVDREVATLFADEGCRFSSASIAPASGGRYVVVAGHTCIEGRVITNWQFYIIDPAERSATQVGSDEQPSSFFWFTRANSLFPTPNGETVLFTVPDGFASHSVAIAAMNLADPTPQIIVPNYAQMPRFNRTQPYAAVNHASLLSPDGRWLAVVTNDPNNDATLKVIDLERLDLPPIEVSAGARGDVISEMFFTPDSSRLLFVTGLTGGGNNSLVALDLNSASDFRVRRGAFWLGAVSPDGRRVAIDEWQTTERGDRFLNLVIVDVESSAHTTIFEGARINDEGRLEDVNFVYPLAWLRAG